MVSTKFETRNIGEALELPSKAVTGVWSDIALSQENIDAWPENGDITEMQDILYMHENDDTDTIPNDEQQRQRAVDSLYGDGGDF